MNAPPYTMDPRGNLRRMMAFIDGENLTFTYQDILKEGKETHGPETVKHRLSTYVWSPQTIQPHKQEVLRATYYTSGVGNDVMQSEFRSAIKTMTYAAFHGSLLPNTLTPYVFKKNKQSQKSKRVDVKLTVDMLSNCYHDNLDTVYLVTGDVDYLPAIKEVRRMGKQVFLAFFKEGKALNQELLDYVDLFIPIDHLYFKS